MTNTAHLTELGHSPDALAQRRADLLALLRQTAPEVLSDNQINIEKLKELLGQERIAPAEHYELNWAGKTEARREIQKTSSHTLRPDANNPAHAQHMLIEGENLPESICCQPRIARRLSVVDVRRCADVQANRSTRPLAALAPNARVVSGSPESPASIALSTRLGAWPPFPILPSLC